MRAIRERVVLTPDLEVMDFGAGTGLLTSGIAEQVGVVNAVDVSAAMAMQHVQDTAALFRSFYAHLAPGGSVALADLDAEDGSFHPPDTAGVFHAGFDRAALGAKLTAAGFVDVVFDTATVVHREGRDYPIFLVTARRA